MTVGAGEGRANTHASCGKQPRCMRRRTHRPRRNATARPIRRARDDSPVTDGVILYDKPAGVTSHDVVAQVRRSLPRKTKVGHAGTLDPFATGLLLVLVGRATRIQRFLMELPKRYRTVARLGAVSTTGDPEGEITHTGRVPGDPLPLPHGRIRQRPPAYSAVKIDGERAYRRARRGEAVLVPEREVTIYRCVELWRDGERAELEIECSAGTYIRTLVADLGDAYCETLRRTGIGPFDVDQADPERVVPIDEALGFLPARDLDGEAARRAAHGRPVEGDADGVVRLRDADGLIALAEPRDGRLKPIVGFRG
jgi:tRNA pseudouridine55 synthase